MDASTRPSARRADKDSVSMVTVTVPPPFSFSGSPSGWTEHLAPGTGLSHGWDESGTHRDLLLLLFLSLHALAAPACREDEAVTLLGRYHRLVPPSPGLSLPSDPRPRLRDLLQPWGSSALSAAPLSCLSLTHLSQTSLSYFMTPTHCSSHLQSIGEPQDLPPVPGALLSQNRCAQDIRRPCKESRKRLSLLLSPNSPIDRRAGWGQEPTTMQSPGFWTSRHGFLDSPQGHCILG